jgi:tRNA A37 threonylcarbamoyladenosine dehydratase
MQAVFSTENAKYPWADGSVCDVPEPGSALKLDCESGFGTAAQVTGTFGFAAAAEAIRVILETDGVGEPVTS